MKTPLKYVVSAVAAIAFGGAIALAPISSAAVRPGPVVTTAPTPAPGAGTDPLVPYGTDPHVPYRLGYINPNHDEGNTSNGEVDVPF
jgi:hypothetical protein